MPYRTSCLVQKGLLLGLWVFILLKATLLCAAIVPNLYDASLTCQTQSDQERQILFQQGLIQVLERISGETTIKNKSQAKQALSRAQDYVEQYIYQGNVLKIKYSADLINQLMGEIGHSVWGQRRPNVILWLAIQEKQQRRIIGTETDPAVQTLIVKLAEKKGLPLTLPLMDLEDMAAVSVSDVWGQFPSVLTEASNRYGSQIILVGRITRDQMVNPENWESNWQLLTQREIPAWQVKGQSLEAVLDQGLSSALHYLMGRYGAKDPSIGSVISKPILIAVQNIRSTKDFGKVESYLNGLSQIVSVDTHQVAGQVAVFAVTLQGEKARQDLEQRINADHFLTAAVHQDEVVEADMIFRLEPFLNAPNQMQTTINSPEMSAHYEQSFEEEAHSAIKELNELPIDEAQAPMDNFSID